jgi:hypothetical protein
MISPYRVVLRTICADLDLRYDFTVSHETISLPGNKMYVVRLKKFSLQNVIKRKQMSYRIETNLFDFLHTRKY